MTEKQVKKYIGKKNWKDFMKWMGGQTIGLDKKGNTIYYDCDVEAFKVLLDTSFDRQKSPWWD